MKYGLEKTARPSRPDTEEEGKAWLAALSSSIMARIGGNMLKMIPIVGSLIGGVSMSIMSGASTYAVGQIAVSHFSNRGSFEDLDINKAKEDFDKAYEEGKDFVKKTNTAEDSEKDRKRQQDAIELLEKLSTLHKNGILSDDEFAAKKSEILQRL